MKYLIVFLLILLAASTVVAQDNPTVEIVLSQPVARQGDIIAADVYVRNGVHVGGIDIGIVVDNTCLRILDRQPGGYLPTTSENGAFLPFAEMNEHDTRLAAALTDRTKHANGDGVFYSVQLEVICETGTAPLEFTYAKLSTYADPAAEAVSLISYDLAEGTLNAINTQLTIDPAAQVEAVPTSAPVATVDAQLPEATSAATVEVPLPEATSVATVDEPTQSLQDLQLSVCRSERQTLVILIVVMAIGFTILLVLAFLLGRLSARGVRKKQ